jgi:predicted TIM-barrel fold metal-dependent hydrolase
MPTSHGSKSAAVRSRLKHPVIDSDGHWLEFEPQITDYLKDIAGPRLAEAYRSREQSVIRVLSLSPEQRWDERHAQPAWWPFPTKNTIDRATAMLPRLMYERLDEIGLDFAVLYPTIGLAVPFISDEEMRRAACRGFNNFVADQFREYSDRLTPAAIIPMHTPQEAVEELEHVVRTLGLKVVVMASLMRRPIPSVARKLPELTRYAGWFEMLGLDSEYDYDSVWGTCAELRVSPTFHTIGRGYGMRVSPTNFTYNHVGHFAAAGEAVCKALFLGGVTRRFPALKFAFLEGGAGWGCTLYSDLIGHWKRRNSRGLEAVDPANLDWEMLAGLFRKYGGKSLAGKVTGWKPNAEALVPSEGPHDDFAACGIEREEDFLDLFVRSFYFGCEADDPINAWAFNTKVNPHGARFNVLFGSDIGHFDVPDMTEVVAEAHELVGQGLITEENFRDFVFANPVRFWAENNLDFFKGTVVEKQAQTVLSRPGGELGSATQA